MRPMIDNLTIILGTIRTLMRRMTLCAAGLRHSRSAKKYRDCLQDWEKELKVQYTRLLNFIGVLLSGKPGTLDHPIEQGLVDLENEFYNGRIPHTLTSPRLATYLGELFGGRSLNFEGPVSSTSGALLLISDGLSSSRYFQASVETEGTRIHKRQFREFQRLFRDSTFTSFNGLRDALQQVNSKLERTNVYEFRRGVPEDVRKSPLSPHSQLRLARKEAKAAFRALSSPKSWRCLCAVHNILLRLDAYRDVILPGRLELGIPPHTATALSTSTKSVRSFVMEWSTTSTGCASVHASDFGVGVPSGHNRPNYLDSNVPKSRLHESHTSIFGVEGGPNLCNFFGDLHPNLKHQRHYLQSDTNPAPTFYLTASDWTCQSTNFVDLSATGCSIGYHNRKHVYEPRYGPVSLQDRLTIAATLAHNTFKLQGNWLRDRWACEEVLIPVTSGEQPTLMPRHMYAVAPVDDFIRFHTATDDRGGSAHGSSGRMILRPLGEALCEVLLSKEELAKLSQFNRHLDALERLYALWGCSEGGIANAVRECLVWSGPASRDGFDDENFSAAAFHKVIWPIITSLEQFEGRTGALSSPSNPRTYGDASLSGKSRGVFGDVYGGMHQHYHFPAQPASPTETT